MLYATSITFIMILQNIDDVFATSVKILQNNCQCLCDFC